MNLKFLVFVFGAANLLQHGSLGLTSLPEAVAPRMFVDFSSQPDPTVMNAFDLCLVDVEAEVDLETANGLGSQVLARVNLFEVKQDSKAAKAAEMLEVPLLEGSSQGMLRLDATHPNWSRLVVRVLVQRAAVRGFDGVVLTGLETMSHEAERVALLHGLEAVRESFPDKQVILEGGMSLVREARRLVDGVLFTDFCGAAADEMEHKRQTRNVQEAVRLGLKALVVGFAAADQAQNITRRAQAVRELGGVPFFTTPELSGVNLGPLFETSRRVLVLHSGPAEQCFTARFLHGSLQWLGMEVVYLSMEGKTETPKEAHAKLSGVIFDATLTPEPGHEAMLTGLTRHLLAGQVPMLFLSLPWHEQAAWSEARVLLGLGGGSAGERRIFEEARVSRMNGALMRAGQFMSGGKKSLLTLQAPADAEVALTLRSGEWSSDQVFFCSWGGVWLEPGALEAGTQLRPLSALERWLKNRPAIPVADTTSQDGRRLLVCMVGPEGFDTVTARPGLPTAAEVMLDEVLAEHHLPFSVALCEGDLRGWTAGHTPEDHLRRLVAGRALFQLPNVEPASGTLSRPLLWTPGTAVTKPLNPAAVDVRRGMEREIAGSLAWLHRELLPGQMKGLPLLLWPKGATPSEEALAFARRMGVETVATWAFEGYSGEVLPPRSWGKAHHFQTWLHHPSHAGTWEAAALLRHADAQGTDRWLAPVQVCLDFSDVANESRLAETRRLLEGCAARPLHAVSTAAYARLVRDAEHTRIFEAGAQRWIIVNRGQARTLRLPASAGVPDLARSSGVTGYARHGADLYVHTLGRERTVLQMRQESAPPERLHLAHSNASVRWLEAGSRRALMQVSHSRKVEMIFAGLEPGGFCELQTDTHSEYLVADTQGRVAFTVAPKTTLQLKIVPARHAALR